ncbi:hypothetical protein [Ammoniphilus sp. CFH 90114]|uniref:hypothetical protein n=1 Tax=Ammoniphilus sp. CFH 90114 TaxID=2493665 RepID=UPI00100E2AEA|nr:hypothetical protein [Ammoniphilus sp. CFH 90114]RXT06396.1 hypothetical protein EIZ39_15110 [Ammoniphilus sp. CFH 90114]
MSNKEFYMQMFQDSGYNDMTYKVISQSILGDPGLNEQQKIEQLEQMNEAYEQGTNVENTYS